MIWFFFLLKSLYEHSGWLALLVLGVPVLVISIVCYALCCMEPFDDSIFERQEGEGEGDGDEDGHSLTGTYFNTQRKLNS